MAGSEAEWQRYHRWNDAIARVVFAREAAGRPVYLDLEDDVLAAIRDLAEPDAPDAAAALIEAVKGTLVFLDGPGPVLRGHLNRLARWREGDELDPPPTLALLALLSLAAENMHEGEGMKPHNFYGRLGALLHLSERARKWFIDAYMKKREDQATSALLWSSLNDWLEVLEGNRGLPTAVALGPAHIGLPLSQALVRQTDRDRFGDLFALNGLAPRSSLLPLDMEELIAEWVARKPCPASNTLEQLWSASVEARDRITSVALQTLEAWDGTSSVDPSSTGGGASIDLVRARATIRSFPSRRVDISLVIPGSSEVDGESVEVLDGTERVIGSLDLVPAASGYLGLADSDSIDVASFLVGDVELRRTSQARPMRRRPRLVVPLRHEPLLSSFVECERLQLGEESLLLVRSDHAAQAEDLLGAVARPGFERIDDLPGVPDEWTIFAGVQVVSSTPAEMRGKIRVDLNVLQPLNTSQVVLDGGLRLPGNIPKWSSLSPPELRATTGDDGELSASIECIRPMTNPEPTPREQAGAHEVLIWDLAQENLPDGDYEITVRDGEEVLRTEPLRLRSADTRAVLLDDDARPVAHAPGSRSYGLVAARTDDPGAFQGVGQCSDELADGEPPSVPGWRLARGDAAVKDQLTQRLAFPTPDAKSCIVTGAHYMSIPMVTAGMTTVKGVCKHCGLMKRYPATRGKKKRSKGAATKAGPPRIDVSALPPVERSQGIDWQLAFDAVCHVGAGAASSLERIAAQMDGARLFGDAFERQLEVLGHIETERDPSTLRALHWQVVDPMVVGLPDGTAVLCGFRSERSTVAVEEYVFACEGEVVTESAIDAPQVLRIKGLSEGDLTRLAAAIGDATGREASYVTSGAQQLAACLKPLSVARQGLPTTGTIAARTYERWDPVTARFRGADDSGGPGAYRLTSFTRTYVYRSADDLGAMRATLGDARIVKYLAAADAGQSLLGYDEATRVLYVPLGADLPGLYGRAAVLATGYPPITDTEERILRYRGVPPTLAAHLDHLLMS